MRFRIVLVSLLMMFNFCKVIHAERVELDGIFYDLSDEAKTASVAGYESYVDESFVDTVVIPEKVTYNEQEYVVTAIGDNAFYSCNDLKHVTIPNTVTSIGEGAFYQCWWLKEIQIPNSVVTIGANAFNYCSGLTFLTLPSSIVSIGDDAFTTCYKLREIYNQSDLNIVAGSETYGNIAYYATNVYNEEGANKIKLIDNFVFYEDADNVVLLGQLTDDSVAVFPDTYCGKNYSIGEFAFEGHTFTNITLPKSVTCIEKNAFYDYYGVECTVNYKGTMADWCNIDFNYDVFSNYLDFFASKSLYIDGECITKNTELIIPEGVTEIKPYSFYGFGNLVKLTLPNGLTSIGDYAFEGCSSLTSITLPDGLTSIGNYAFAGCSSLTNITLPDGLTWIAYGTFSYCSSLTSITLPEGLTWIGGAFYNCSSLASITLPDGLTSIGDDAFWGCSSLTSITLPDGLTSIGDYAFEGCSSLTSITLPDGVMSIGLYAFNGTALYNTESNWDDGVLYIGDYLIKAKSYISREYAVKDGTTSIVERAFEYCSSLTSITIPDGLTSIGDYAFSGCSALTSITLPEGLTSIGERTFSSCKALTSITIPDGLTSIGDYAFYACEALTRIILPESLTSIGEAAFLHCYSLTSITLPEGLTSIGDNAFGYCSALISINVVSNNNYYTSVDGVLFNKDMTTLIQYPAGKDAISYTIPEGLKSIGAGAFYGCSSLTNITIPDGVTSIGEYAFFCCSALTSITIPDGVTSIGEDAFRECSALISLTLPDGLTSIGDYAFDNCSSLTSITIPDGVTSIGDWAFAFCFSITSITLPDGLTSIGGEAFYGCTKLYEVYNMSSLDIRVGETTNGRVAYYARNVYTEEGGSKIDQIGDYQFYVEEDNVELISYIGNATDLILPDDYRGACYTIGHHAFYFHDNITSLTIPYCVTSIGNSAFEACSNMKEIFLSEGVSSIGNNAFRLCTSLNSVVIPNSVTHIGNDAFYGCMNLKHITLSNSMERINYGLFYDCGSLVSIVIPSSVVNIDGMSFYGCVSLKDVRVEDAFSKLEIGYNDMFGEKQWLFADCPLESVYIGRDLSFDTSKNAGYSPFYNQTGLKTVIIGENVTKLENYLLYNCSGIEKIISFSTTPPKASRLTFAGVNKDVCSVTVPVGSLADYSSAAYWKSFFNVVEADLSGVGSIQTNNLKPVYYNLNGQRVLNPSEGIYIQNGRKVYIR